VLLAEQDRSRWDAQLAEEGRTLVAACIRRGRPGPYQLQAAINAVHSEAATAEDTDWDQILANYDLLVQLNPTAVVALNRAVAVAEVEGPEAALAVVDGLELERYHLYHSTRGELLSRLGRAQQAAEAYEQALTLATNPTEQAFLRGRLTTLRG
jgi:RNA polymerase sigma-70 factor (ECF subfamily)